MPKLNVKLFNQNDICQLNLLQNILSYMAT
jgi:hypothetical protein